MVLRKIVMSTAAASAIMLALSVAPAPFSFASVAHAETSVSVNFGFGSFYNGLQPYGSWVAYEDDYVFVPQHIDHNWRPYTLGHWSYTHRYGWLWVSSERFGWATYHYGRWGHSRDIGWYWVPGHRWAPAWVAWSRGQNEVAWAPLPPRRGHDVEVSITIGDVPDYYWQAVPTSAFLSINLSDKVIRDRNQVRTIVQQSPPETVRIENNIVINNVIQVNEIEKATNTKVPVLIEKPVTDPNAVGKTDATTVAIFNPDVKVDTTAKPKKALKVEEVVFARKAQGIQPEDLTSDQPAAAAPKLDKNGKPIAPANQPAAAAVTLDKNGKPIAPVDQPAAAAVTLDKNGKPIAPADQPAAKVQVPADGKANADAPAVVAPVVKAPDLKTAPAAVPVIETPVEKPKVVVPAAKAPDVKTPPAAAPVVDAPVTKPKVVAPVVKVPEVKTPPATAPVVEAPVEKPKKVKPVVTPPADTGKATTDVPVEKSKKKKDAGTTDQKTIDQSATPPADAQTPPADGKKAQEPVKKDEKGKAKCDPNVETCPPAQ